MRLADNLKALVKMLLGPIGGRGQVGKLALTFFDLQLLLALFPLALHLIASLRSSKRRGNTAAISLRRGNSSTDSFVSTSVVLILSHFDCPLKVFFKEV